MGEKFSSIHSFLRFSAGSACLPANRSGTGFPMLTLPSPACDLPEMGLVPRKCANQVHRLRLSSSSGCNGVKSRLF